MKLVTKTEKITVAELREMSEKMFGNLVKAVVDIKKEIMLVDAGMHADEEAELLKNGSRQKDLWGINFHPDISGDNFVEFDSIINLRPSQGNRSRGVDDKNIQENIMAIVNDLVKK